MIKALKDTRNGSSHMKAAITVTKLSIGDRLTRTHESKRFSFTVLPPSARKTPRLTKVLLFRHAHGLSGGASRSVQPELRMDPPQGQQLRPPAQGVSGPRGMPPAGHAE